MAAGAPMEHFPFEQVIGLIVFVIIALAQFWTKLRTGKPLPRTGEEEPEFQFPESESVRPAPQKPAPPPASRTPPVPPLKLDDLLREALGLPGEAKPPPPPATRAPTRSPAPPPMLQQPQRQGPVIAAPTPFQPPVTENVPATSVIASLERLEREAAQIRERVGRLGQLQVAAGAEAEARMRQRLAGLMKNLHAGQTPAAGPGPSLSFVGRMLSDRKTVRRAIVLNEIIGSPRGLNPYY